MRVMKSREESKGRANADDTSIAKFLAQPAYHADEDSLSTGSEGVPPMDDVARQTTGSFKGFATTLRRFLFEKSTSHYSSISPRLPNGTRTKLFPFNGSGKGR